MSKPDVLFDKRMFHRASKYHNTYLSIAFRGDILPSEATYVTFDTDGHIVGLYEIDHVRKNDLFKLYKRDVRVGLTITPNSDVYVNDIQYYCINPFIVSMEIIPPSRLHGIDKIFQHPNIRSEAKFNELLKMINSNYRLYEGGIYVSRGETDNVVIDGILYEPIYANS